MTAEEIFKDELRKIAEEESTARKVLHHPLATAAAITPFAAYMGSALHDFGHRLSSKAKGQFSPDAHWTQVLPDVNWRTAAGVMAPMFGLLAARKLFPRKNVEKTAEYPRFRDPVNDRTQPEVSRGLEPTFRVLPRPRPVAAPKLPSASV